MSLIFNALFYEGILSICIIILYFVIEPRFNVGNEKNFFSSRNVCAIIISIPFMQFLVGFIFQSQTCETANNYLCFGYPDVLNHSFFYDIFYLRVNDTYNGAHWLDYMFLPILYFITWAYTKDPFFSALNAGFMVFIHEALWFVFYWVRYYYAYQYEGWINDYAFFLLVSVIGFIGLVKYRQYYRNKFVLFGIICYCAFLVIWTLEGFTVTVINNNQVGDSLKFLITQWYYDALTNVFEVLSWIAIFLVFLLNVIINAIPKNTIET